MSQGGNDNEQIWGQDHFRWRMEYAGPRHRSLGASLIIVGDFHAVVVGPYSVGRRVRISWLINIGFAILIFVIGRCSCLLVVRVAKTVMSRAKLDPILIHFIASLLTGLLVLIAIVAAIDQLGVDTTSFVAIIGAAGLRPVLRCKNR